MKRLIYIPIIILIIALGISSRKFPEAIPYFVHEHAGDVLWAAMVYFGFRFIFYKRHYLFSGLLALTFSFLIEFSQLYQSDWINNIRSTTLGALILGSGFLWIDFLRYTFGVSIGILLDIFWEKILKRRGSGSF